MAKTGIVEGDRVSIEGVVTGINADGTVSLALDGYTLARLTVAEHWLTLVDEHWLTLVEKREPGAKGRQKKLLTD